MKEVGFEAGFEGLDGGGVSEGFGECIPKGWGSKSKSSVAPGTFFGGGDNKEVSVSRPEGAGRGIGFQEITEVCRSKVV